VYKKGGVACVNVPDIQVLEGELEWLVPPGVLAAGGKKTPRVRN
jgi:hypothetical protein